MPNNPLLFSTYTPFPNKMGRVTATPENILILEELVEAARVEPSSVSPSSITPPPLIREKALERPKFFATRNRIGVKIDGV
ncbi:MAG: hypothetical protein GX444_20705 [Myxococcales bacterium]|nr:hypothetical protein [Myxococcales bacterium]